MEHSQSELKIYFLGEEVENVFIMMNNASTTWNGRTMWSADNKYSDVKVFYDCNGLHIVGEGNVNGEMFIPSTSIKRFWVDYPEGHMFEKS